MAIAQARLPPLRSGELMRAIAHLTAITATASLLTLTAPPATTAQLIPDTTLGSENSQVTPGALIHGLPADLIEGGAPRGSNLFHSFQEFNVGDLQRVYFDNPAGITNIFSRVTGGNPSQILGTLGVAGSANLFFLNPNGLLFGPKAQLDIAGSFFASTADRWLFDNGLEFSATNPAAPSPLLTISITPGLQSGTAHHAGISSQGNLVTGGDLTLHGGWLDLQGTLQAGGALTLHATDTLRLRDTATTPFIAAARGNLLVQGNNQVDIFTLNHPDSGFYAGGDLLLRSSNAVGGDAHFWSGGNFRVEQLDGSSGDLFSPHDPIIIAGGDVSFDNYQGGSLHILAAGSVTLSDVLIDNIAPVHGLHLGHANSFLAGLAEFTDSQGNNVVVDGTKYYTLDVRAGIDWSQFTGFPGHIALGIPIPTSVSSSSANINISSIETSLQPFISGAPRDGGQIFLTNQYFPNHLSGSIDVAGTIDTRDFLGGGKVLIDSRNDIVHHTIEASGYRHNNSTFQGNGGSVNLFSNGNIFGNGTIHTSGLLGGDVAIRNGSSQFISPTIISRSYSETPSGQGGNISIHSAGQFLLINGSNIDTRSLGAATAGSVSIIAPMGILIQDTLNLNQDTSINVNTIGQGNAGNIILDSGSAIILVNRGFLFANTFRDFSSPNTPLGNAGNIIVRAGKINLWNGSFFSVASQSEGRAGSIDIHTDSAVNVIGTNPEGLPSLFIFGGFSSGDAGLLRIHTDHLLVSGGGLISGTAYGSGKSGNISINARQSVTVTGNGMNAPSGLVYETTGLGNAGTFTLATDHLNILDGGNVSAQSIGSGSAGIFDVRANSILIRGKSNDLRFQSRLFFDSSTAGNAGELTINTNQLHIQDGGLIAANTSGSGQGGLLNVNARDLLTISGVGSGLFFESSGDGDARGITITTDALDINNGGSISVSGSGQGRSGNLSITTNSLYLSNQSSLRATTTAREGGNIDLRVANNIILRRNSEISAEAFGNSDGGNIRIEAGGFILAILKENSDIVANAYAGRGGTIYARALGIFGFRQFRGQRTSESDFTASSQIGIDGIVTLDIDRLQEDIPLSSQFSDTPLVEGCNILGNVGFSSTGQDYRNSTLHFPGQGGMPSSPDEGIRTGVIATPWLDLNSVISSHEKNSGTTAQGQVFENALVSCQLKLSFDQ